MNYHFDDLLDIRVGGPSMRDGAGDSRIAKITAVQQWEEKTQALRELFYQTLGHQPELSCETEEKVLSETGGARRK